MASRARSLALVGCVAAAHLVVACKNPGVLGEERDGRSTRATPSATATVARPAWPSAAPPPYACQKHEECTVAVWDAPQPPDPCCDARVGYLPMSRAHLAYMEAFKKASCRGVACPPAPLPGAEPACCASIGRCVAQKCISACDDPTAHVPAVSVLDSECSAARLPPIERAP